MGYFATCHYCNTTHDCRPYGEKMICGDCEAEIEETTEDDEDYE